MDVRDYDNGFGGRGGDLVIFAEAAGVVQPAEGTLNHPAPREFLPFVRLDFLGNINTSTEFLPNIKHKSASIARVGAEFLDGRIVLNGAFSG